MGEAPDPRETEPGCALCHDEEALLVEGLCAGCAAEVARADARHDELYRQGHTSECAGRQVFGDGKPDGECGCASREVLGGR